MSVKSGFFEAVYAAVERIPCGKVASYGQIAAAVGSPGASRTVGWALHVNPRPGIVPCHRVVNRFGRTAPAFAFGGAEVQRSLLEREGVAFDGDGNVERKYFVQTDELCAKESAPDSAS